MWMRSTELPGSSRDAPNGGIEQNARMQTVSKGRAGRLVPSASGITVRESRCELD